MKPELVSEERQKEIYEELYQQERLPIWTDLNENRLSLPSERIVFLAGFRAALEELRIAKTIELERWQITTVHFTDLNKGAVLVKAKEKA